MLCSAMQCMYASIIYLSIYLYICSYIVRKDVCLYGMVWYGMIQYGMVCYDTVWYGIVSYRIALYGMYVCMHVCRYPS